MLSNSHVNTESFNRPKLYTQFNWIFYAVREL
jgi:hypothetical protein